MNQIIKSNVVELWKSGEIVCVTTNGFIKKNGQAVMGRGNALAMATAIPRLPMYLANHIKTHGHIVGPIYKKVISFPVKPIQGKYKDVLPHMRNKYKETDIVPGFFCKAEVGIIKKSVEELNRLIENNNNVIKTVYLPIPGINNGQLNFSDISEVLNKLHHKVILTYL
jgi:hypothetical protein